MLNQKDVSELMALMFHVGASALGYAATTTTLGATTSTAATPNYNSAYTGNTRRGSWLGS